MKDDLERDLTELKDQPQGNSEETSELIRHLQAENTALKKNLAGQSVWYKKNLYVTNS